MSAQLTEKEKELDSAYDEGYEEGKKDTVKEIHILVEDAAWEVGKILENLRKQIDKAM